jgi:uncharacterized RDD family membrane protein YckC
MPNASLQTTSVNRARATIALFGGMGVMALVIMLLIQLPDLPAAVMIGGLVAAFAAYVATATLGVRRWALTHVRYELDEAGLREIGASGELRDRVRWSDMREYVVDAVVAGGANIRYLRITRQQGKPLRITEPQTRAGREEFAAFCSHFLAAVAQNRVTEPTAAVREGISWYDKPVAHALGVTMLVLLVLLVPLSFLVPQEDAGLLRMKSIVWIALAAPFIYRTVFNRRTVPAA